VVAKRFLVRMDENQAIWLQSVAKAAGYQSLNRFICTQLLKDMPQVMLQSQDFDFSIERAERRSFHCPNKLWNELVKKTKNVKSISMFVREALQEKLEKSGSSVK
jgi:hypothetical protein